MAKLIGILLSLISISAAADIYQWTDKKGNVQFAESLPKNVQSIHNMRKLTDKNLPPIIPMVPTQYIEYPYATTQQRTIVSQNADWNTCAWKKREAIKLEKRHEKYLSEEINTWLWQNCRGYSNELRTIEQEMM